MRSYKQVGQSSIYRSKEKREKKEEQRRKKAQIAKYKKDKAREQMQEAIDGIKQTKHSLERIEERMSVSEHRVRKSIVKSIINRRIPIEYNRGLDNYRIRSPLGVYIVSSDLKVVTVISDVYKTPVDKHYKSISYEHRIRLREMVGIFI